VRATIALSFSEALSNALCAVTIGFANDSKAGATGFAVLVLVEVLMIKSPFG
jgi:hypothetical protein